MTDLKNSALYYLSKINGNRGKQFEVMNGLVKAMSIDERFPKPIRRTSEVASRASSRTSRASQKPLPEAETMK